MGIFRLFRAYIVAGAGVNFLHGEVKSVLAHGGVVKLYGVNQFKLAALFVKVNAHTVYLNAQHKGTELSLIQGEISLVVFKKHL